MPLDTTLASKLAEPFILALLEREPTHPYALMKAIEETFDQSPGKGRIYQMMKRLEQEGIVEGKESEGRGLYSLTEKGRGALAAYRTKPLRFYDFVEDLWGMQKPVTIGGKPRTTADAPSLAGRALAEFHGATKVGIARDYGADRITITIEGLEALVADRAKAEKLLAALELIAGSTLPG